MKKTFILFILALFFFGIFNESRAKKWKKKAPSTAPFTIFKSTKTLNQNTAEVIAVGDFFYGISHRFKGAVSTGYEEFFGLDGGANMRTLIGYGFTNSFMATLGRTSQGKQYDLELKYKIFASDKMVLPMILSFNAGTAITSLKYGNFATQPDGDSRRMQYFTSLIFNTMLFDKLAIGLAPSFLYNSVISSIDPKNSITLGSFIQYYIGDDMTSIILEANNTLSGFRGDGRSKFYDSYALGLELETGGHFFKFYFGNNTSLNQSQYLLGSVKEMSLDNIVFGFQITRNF
jgi:Membrane bound beta barrel domain (DUF5777)